ncbi:MAG: hypothetical protein IPK31_12250 [Chitinophagaceae bacterium]|nr:hypothetical protein [Chitinophagaceae bacterium]
MIRYLLNFATLSSLFFFLVSASCSKKSNNENTPTIYSAGYIETLNGSRYSMFWKNQTGTKNSTLDFAYAPQSLFVSGSDVYIAANENYLGKTQARLLKNGNITDLNQGLTNGSYARSVYVSGQDVYVGGAEIRTNNNVTARVWKNGAGLNLSKDISDSSSYVNSIFVSGSDVYATGIIHRYTSYNNFTALAVVWKNGKIETNLLTTLNNSQALSIFVDGSDVFVAGNESLGGKYVARLWKNGNATTLPSQSNTYIAYSVYVTNNDVYVAGYEDVPYGYKAKLWKNGIPVELGGIPNQSSMALSVFVLGSDVYVGGKRGDGNGNWVATVWKNGIPISLSVGSVDQGAFSIFVK